MNSPEELDPNPDPVLCPMILCKGWKGKELIPAGEERRALSACEGPRCCHCTQSRGIDDRSVQGIPGDMCFKYFAELTACESDLMPT